MLDVLSVGTTVAAWAEQHGAAARFRARVADGAFGPRYEWEERHVAKIGADARLACQTTIKGGDAATVTLQAK